MNKMLRKNINEDYKRVNNDTWICNQLEDLLIKYEKFLRSDTGRHLDNFEHLSDFALGENNAIDRVVRNLKELLYNPNYEDNLIGRDDFISALQDNYGEAIAQGSDSVVLIIDTDVGNTYYIYDTPGGFQCNLWDYYFDDLGDLAGRLYMVMRGKVIDIRIE